MDAAIKTNPMGMRAPSLSVTAPRRKRQKISPVTATMLVVQISFLDNFKVFFTSGKRGAMENQMKKAMKKDHQE